MKQPKKPQKNLANKADEEADSAIYRAIGLVFLIVGVALVLPESTRLTGLPFLVLGMTFIALSKQDKSPKSKK